MKRSHIQYAIRFIVFVIIFCLILDKLTYVLSFKQKAGDNIGAFYLQEEDSVDVVIVGSSHAYSSFIPMELWHQEGITSFNLGTPSQSIPCSYFLIKEAIRTQSPKVIVLESYGAIYEDYYYSDSRLHIALDSIPYGSSKMEIITDFLPKFMDYKTITEYVFPIVKFHSRWTELEPSDFEYKNTELKGYQFYTKVKKVKEPEYTKETEPIFDGTLEYMDKIIKLCEDNNVELVLMKVPMAGEDSYKPSIRANTLHEYVEAKGIKAIDLDDYIEEMDLDYNKDFRNSTHLNYFGALKVTDFLKDYLLENYDLADHRGDEAYKEWDEVYKKYCDRVNKKLKELKSEKKDKKKKK